MFVCFSTEVLVIRLTESSRRSPTWANYRNTRRNSRAWRRRRPLVGVLVLRNGNPQSAKLSDRRRSNHQPPDRASKSVAGRVRSYADSILCDGDKEFVEQSDRAYDYYFKGRRSDRSVDVLLFDVFARSLSGAPA